MNIILLKRKKGSSGVIPYNKKKIASALVLVFVVLPIVFMYSGYKMGYEVGVSPVYSDKNPDLITKVFDPKYKSKYKNRFQAYKNQTDALVGVQNSLDDLKKFISKQETKLKIEQTALEHILNQKETLKPLLSADQEIVDALFMIQNKKNRIQKWIDIAIGLVIGIFASLIGAYIFNNFELKFTNTKKQADEDDKTLEEEMKK